MTDYCIYLLTHSIHNKTYLGITNNFKRRLRQHNGYIKGGAKATTCFKGNGFWFCHLRIHNLTKSKALSFERIIKNKRRKGKGKTPVARRIHIIESLGLKYKLADNLILRYI